jgi:hypothetical protein
LLSYCTHSLTNTFPETWHQKTVTVRRHVAGFACHRRRVREILVSNRSFTT